MVALLQFIEYLCNAAISIVVFIVVAYAIVTWLVAFNVLNMRNRFAYQVTHALESIAMPILAPIQRVLPAPGGVDISPIVLLVLLGGIQRFLLPALFGWLISLAAPTPGLI